LCVLLWTEGYVTLLMTYGKLTAKRKEVDKMKWDWKMTLVSLMMIIFAFMMIDTMYLKAIGDYILEAVGLSAWSNGDMGVHLTIVYFGIPFLVCFFWLSHRLRRANRKPVVFVILIVGCIVLSFLTTQGVLLSKTLSNSLYALTYDNENANIQYRVENDKLKEFRCEVTLTNHGSQPQQFELSIKGLQVFISDETHLTILDETGNPATFKLDGKETRTFVIEYPEFEPSYRLMYNNGGFGGTIQTILLKDAISGETYEFSERFQGLMFGK